jgi:hypothetical protein
MHPIEMHHQTASNAMLDFSALTRPYDPPITVNCEARCQPGPGEGFLSGTRFAPCVQESTMGTRSVRLLPGRATGALGR